MFAPADASSVVWHAFDAMIFAALFWSVAALIFNVAIHAYELRIRRLRKILSEMRAADADSRENPRQEPIDPTNAMKINKKAK